MVDLFDDSDLTSEEEEDELIEVEQKGKVDESYTVSGALKPPRTAQYSCRELWSELGVIFSGVMGGG